MSLRILSRNLLQILIIGFLGMVIGCASLPETQHDWHSFPERAYFGVPKRKFKPMGQVKSRVDYPTLDPNHDEKKLCINYFNKAVKKLVGYAKKKGADAVIDVRSVAVYMDGKVETFPRAECVDEGAEGQVLAQGIAVKWLPTPKANKKSKSL